MEKRTIYLFERYVTHELSSDEARELKDFIESSEGNRSIFLNFAMLHKTRIQNDMLMKLNIEDAWENIKRKIDAHKRRNRFLKIAAAASVILLAGAGGFFYKENDRKPELEAMMKTEAQNRAIIILPNASSIKLDSKEKVRYMDTSGNILCENKNGNLTYFTHTSTPLYNTVEVEEGSIYKITLSDGTSITLASGSELVYPIGGNSRDVKLKGEAYFDVRHDDEKPFTVECGDNVKITVLGTKFNVVACEEEPVVVTLESGRVDLAGPEGNTMLAPDQQAIASHDGSFYITSVDAKQYTSWASGIYEFDNIPLDVIVKKLSLWYGIDFKFASEQLKQRTFTGVLLRDKNLNYSLSLLKDVSNLNFKTDGECIIIE